MTRRFNAEGPNDPAVHYTVSAFDRVPGLRRLVEKQEYASLWMPRWAGKTTLLRELARTLTREGRYTAAYLAAPPAAAFPADYLAAQVHLLGAWRAQLATQLPAALQPPDWSEVPPEIAVEAALGNWARHSPRPVVVVLDDVDRLPPDLWWGMKRQIRPGFTHRPRRFPQSMLFGAAGDIRDDASPHGRDGRYAFNILAEQYRLEAFEAEHVAALLAQHTADTGQRTEPDAIADLATWTGGHPRWVNALGRLLVEELVSEPTRPITTTAARHATRLLLQRPDPALDALRGYLLEPRVRAAVAPKLDGTAMRDVSEDERRRVVDLGLLRSTRWGGLEIASPMVGELAAAAYGVVGVTPA